LSQIIRYQFTIDIWSVWMSKLTRRSQVAALAGGLGRRLRRSKAARTKLSMGCWHQLASLNRLLAKVLPQNEFYARKLSDCKIPLTNIDALDFWPTTIKEELQPATADPFVANRTYPTDHYVRARHRRRTKAVRDREDDDQYFGRKTCKRSYIHVAARRKRWILRHWPPSRACSRISVQKIPTARRIANPENRERNRLSLRFPEMQNRQRASFALT